MQGKKPVRRFKLLIFDWDGTLKDSIHHISSAIQQSFRDVGLIVPSDFRARFVIGMGLNDAMNYLDPDLSPKMIKKIGAQYRKHFLKLNNTQLFPNISRGLYALKERGFQIAICTGKTQKGLSDELSSHGMSDIFIATRCADQDEPKPNPKMIFSLISQLSVTPGDAIMIGDTSHDMDMANRAGIASLGVSYGAHPARILSDYTPLHIANTPAEMISWLMKNA